VAGLSVQLRQLVLTTVAVKSKSSPFTTFSFVCARWRLLLVSIGSVAAHVPQKRPAVSPQGLLRLTSHGDLS
jgi:hypothetical protein